ncbi:CTL-like protein [Thecamonas trahens ATCC 50062]|uniref:Choline transporter-like protein n=1 Tax=Thecamonas trahens ATCC 50062 TaxID=461836 RepID=A0A0L0DPR9_THETB|nr:CTL-like protein [Thecamonas trahens ATCC 50062]KNC54304.1 CTL-like protein [Thecamonas trahens ATCC 50062]|eukprot:XP_013753765.1 CTL-like protein [Thecamonas trahens ATCC 50062]
MSSSSGLPPPGYTEPVGKGVSSAPPPMYSDQAPLIANEHGRRQGPPPAPPSLWKDVPFAVAFVLLLVAFVVFSAATWNRNFLNEHKHSENDGQEKSSGSDLDPELLRKMGRIAAYCTGLGLLFAALWLQICKQFPKQMIYIALITNVVICFGIAILFFAYGIIIGGLIWLFFACISVLFYFFWRRRIPFAAQMLATTVGVVHEFPAMVGFSFLSLFALLTWVVMWVFGASSAANINNAGLYVLCVFVFYWVAQVIKNVIHVTSAGTFATWYFFAGSAEFPANPTVGAFKRATTYSFGSVCFGSLIIAVIQTVRFVLRSARRANRNQFVVACADCLLGCIESLVQYFNVYAFTQVAVYGKGYREAASDTWDLFKSHGFDVIVNDDLIGSVLGFSSFVSGLMVALAAFAWGAYELGTSAHALPYLIVLVIICFFIGLIEASTVFEVVNSGVAAIMVCFCTAPDVLQQRQPALYNRFRELYGRRIGFFTSG